MRVILAGLTAGTLAACGDGNEEEDADVGRPMDVVFLSDRSEVSPDSGVVDIAEDEPGSTDDAGGEGADVSDPGAPDATIEDEALVPEDQGVDEATTFDPGTQDPGADDPGNVDAVLPHSKKAGQYCDTSDECADDMICVGSELTHPQCNPGCEVDEDCDTVAINANGQCTELEGYAMKVCLWLCGFPMGGICPGDGQCDGQACR